VIACREVSFDLHADEVLGIVGESGSGKSTVVRLLHFDIEPTAGQFRLHLNGAAADAVSWLAPGQNLFAWGRIRSARSATA
jgi:putative phosphonate transport system ATP-binding protein